ncbi:ABC transporter ATP-binding protein [Acetohalobium arabaticum]|uniref:ABC transporter related protein n=1 Tax=Acetohalobium arabaticum (strain ATCC 49924 / DSM 5501 / Z-7288) TaxID=574087 RepID=D9QQT8_ACEAZ|nr:ABC transporter ATP-binding protein [Acetohalobium arabaticum]ADL12879.1 ABC transporter related protein [Acetohalobium arabaticum DSM 5501]
MSAAIKIQDLNKSYGDLQALTDINLKIEKGEFFGLLGPNGAGKSTLIKILGGLADKDSGQVSILGTDIDKNHCQAKRSLGIVPQELIIDPYFNPKETLKLQSGYFGIQDNDEKINEILTAMDLHDKANAYARNLSGGMKRRLLIAKALIHDPDIIVLDEPTAGVDVELRNNLWNYIRQLNNEGKTIILTTHYLKEAEALCDRIAIMDQGHIVAVDTKEKLINSIDKKLVEIKLKEEINQLPKAFSNYKVEINEEVGKITFELSKKEIEDFIRQLYKSEIQIKDIDISSAKLEDVFLKLTNLGGKDN